MSPQDNTFYIKFWVRSRLWFWAFVISCIVCFAIYLINASFWQVQPGSNWGIGYGIAAAILVLGAAAYGIRRRRMKWVSKLGLGRSHTWVQFHVYGGTLFLLLVFMHTGFRYPTGTLTIWLWYLSIWITLSGILGVILQKWIPRALTSGLKYEIHYERIPELIHEIRQRAEKLIESCDESIREFYQNSLAAAFVGPETRWIYYMDITGGIRTQTKHFSYLRKLLPAEQRDKLDRLEQIYKTKLEIDAHYTLQKALRWWLYLHIPVSIVLIVLVGLHLYSVFYY